MASSEPPEAPADLMTWAAREAWPPRTAAEWYERWEADGQLEQFEALLEQHSAILRIPGGSGQAVLFASRVLARLFVTRAFERWCCLSVDVPFEAWARGAETLLTGRKSEEPVLVRQTLRELSGLPAENPGAPTAAQCSPSGWDAVLGAGELERVRMRFRLAAMLLLSPELALKEGASGASQGLAVVVRDPYQPLKSWSDAVIRALKPAHAQVLEGRIFAGLPNREIAKRLGISDARVSQLEARAGRTFRHSLTGKALQTRVLELLGTVGSPVVARLEEISSALEPLFGSRLSPKVLRRWMELVLGWETMDICGLLTWMGLPRRPPFVPAPNPSSSPLGKSRTWIFFDKSKARHSGRGRSQSASSPLGQPDRMAQAASLRLRGLAALGQAELRLTQDGSLRYELKRAGTDALDAVVPRVHAAFARGIGSGLLHLAVVEAESTLDEPLAFWREFAHLFVVSLCTQGEPRPGGSREALAPSGELDWLRRSAPAVPGREFLSKAVLENLWRELDQYVTAELEAPARPLQDFLDGLRPGFHVAGRVHFWLQELADGSGAPFHFRSTYAKLAGTGGRVTHRPLGEALASFAASHDLLALRGALQTTAEACRRSEFIDSLVKGGILFQAELWTAERAHGLLSNLAHVQAAGIEVHVPAWWSAGSLSRPRVGVRIGNRPSPELGLNMLLDFDLEVVLDGQPLNPAELEAVLATRGLMFLRGKWVEVDGARLAQALAHWRRVREGGGGLSVSEALRLLARARPRQRSGPDTHEAWSLPQAGPWLENVLQSLRSPAALGELQAKPHSNLPLRRHQETGFHWLVCLHRLGLGGCLADDMGLGKTLQVLALLEWLKRNDGQGPSLVVVPASLLGHWVDEVRRFTPSLITRVIHRSELSDSDPRTKPVDLSEVDLVLTSYGSLPRFEWLERVPWEVVVLDEAQNIKAADTVSARSVKRLSARARVAVTGTPIENHLGDLWSVFDFLNPGLLGSPEEFDAFLRELDGRPNDPHGPLRRLVAPYLLRRHKSDPEVAAGLPGKLERDIHCSLTPLQAALYQEALEELVGRLEHAAGDWLGILLPYLHRLKQICNHPSQWLGDGRYEVSESGKFSRLQQLVSRIAGTGEKLLVFTQYMQVARPLADLLAGVYGRRGLVMFGQVEVGERREIVRRFQEDPSVPFLVMTLKTGGAGLNLTAANHVVHFDRWWNPAVENQATDRAHRIGQRRCVTVYKFLCRGTLEEKIDRILKRKHALANAILDSEGRALLIELGKDQILAALSLDLDAVSRE